VLDLRASTRKIRIIHSFFLGPSTRRLPFLQRRPWLRPTSPLQSELFAIWEVQTRNSLDLAALPYTSTWFRRRLWPSRRTRHMQRLAINTSITARTRQTSPTAGPRADRPRYHAHTSQYTGWQWRNFVPHLRQLVFAAILWAKLVKMFFACCDITYRWPRARYCSQLMTSKWKPTISVFGERRSWPVHMQKIKVKGQVVQKLEYKQTDRWTHVQTNGQSQIYYILVNADCS